MADCMPLCNDRLRLAKLWCWLFGCYRLWQVQVPVLMAQKLQIARLLVAVCLFPVLSVRVGFQELALAPRFLQALVEV
jgi:hypothetical protein